MAERRMIYWDSCVMLSYVNEDPAHIPHIESFLAQAARGELVIISSVLSVAEVAFGAMERTGRVLDPEVDQKINTLWAPMGPIRLVEFHVLIAERAKDILRAGVVEGWKGLRAVDAMHLATAAQEKASEFHTYDDLEKWGTKAGLRVCQPIAEAPLLGL